MRWEERPDLVTSGRRDAEARVAPRKFCPQRFLIDQSLALGRGKTMLILGDRGAGKSTTLHKLAQALLELAQPELERAFLERNTLNTDAPMPVVLHLSDWERYCQGKPARLASATFQEWLVAALKRRYGIESEFSAPWIDQGILVLLLDGLDELSNETWCNECIKVINQFRQDNQITKIIICCQIEIYTQLYKQLEVEQFEVEQAFCAQPLEPDQIEDFLNQPGENFAKIQVAYQAMHQQFRTPLDLSVIALACQGLSAQDLIDMMQGEEWHPRF